MTRNCYNVMRKIAGISKQANPLFQFMANIAPNPANIPHPPTPAPQPKRTVKGPALSPTTSILGTPRMWTNQTATPTVHTAPPSTPEQLRTSLQNTAQEAHNRTVAGDPRWVNSSKEAPEGAGVSWRATNKRPVINKCNLSVGTALCGGYNADLLRTKAGTLMNANNIYEMLAGKVAPPYGHRVHPLTREEAMLVPGAIVGINGKGQGHVGITSGRGTAYSAATDKGMIDNDFGFRDDGKAYRYGILVPDSVKGGDVRSIIRSYMKKSQ